MAQRNAIVGAQATAIEFTRLKGAASKAPVLQGKVTYAPTQIIKELVEDVHSGAPYYRTKIKPGAIKLTFALDAVTDWLTGDVVDDADLQITFANRRILTATGVTLAADPTENDLTEGTTNERNFHFVSATLI